MRSIRHKIRFQEDTTPDQRELVNLLGTDAAFCLGIPFGAEMRDGNRVRTTHFTPRKMEDDWGFEQRVREQYADIHYRVPRADRLLQAEVGFQEWREFDQSQLYMQASSSGPPNWGPVSFSSRKGKYVGRTIMGIPVVVVPDVGKVVLRPRWPETDRLVQGA